MRAKELMTQELTTISSDATVLEAATLMLERHISGLPVVDRSGELIGMITAGDLLRRAEIATDSRLTGFAAFQTGRERLAANYAQAHGKQVGHVMTTKMHAVSEDASIKEIVDVMTRHDVKRVPVVQGKNLIGLVSRTDILRAFVEAARQTQCEFCGDDEIKNKLLSVYAHESWAPLASINISVRNGIVDLAGRITSEAQRRGLLAAAESMPGVKVVNDHLTVTKDAGEDFF